MLISFFETEKMVPSLCKHFSLDDSCFQSILKSIDPVHDSALDFAQKLGVNLLTDTSDCDVVCRHITTCSDNLSSIMTYGLLPLIQMLSSDTQLKTFLKKYGIEIQPSNYKMIVKNHVFHINRHDERCAVCVFKPAEEVNCRIFCDYHYKMALLHTKLYHDKGEIEAYMSGSDESMLEGYTSIIDGPEILLTVGGILNALYRKFDSSCLQQAWSKQRGMKRYILEFRVPLNALESNPGINEYRDYTEWYDYAGFDCDDYINNRVPRDFYLNKKLMEEFYNTMFSFCDNSYCQIIPSFHVSADRIRIHKEFSM